MLDTTLAAQLDVLTASTRVALADYPQLAKQIRGGLVLAACGLANNPNACEWLVRNHLVSLTGQPARWHCNCEQGKGYGPLTGNFLGYPGRICKHIAAVAIAMNLQQPVAPVATVWEIIERLCQMPPGVLFGDATAVELPRTRARLIYDDPDYYVAIGRKRSHPIATVSGDGIFMQKTAHNAYDELLDKAGIRQPAQQKELI